MAAVNKDFVVKNGLQVGGLATFAAPAGNSGSLKLPSGSDPGTPQAGHLWNNTGALKFYNGSATKTIAFTDSTLTGTWNGGIISPAYGGTGINNGSSTITIGGNVTFSGAYTTTFTVAATTSLTLPATGTVATTSNKLSDFANTTSAELADVITNETGSGVLVFGTSPTFTTSIDGGATFAAFASSTNLTIGGTSSPQTLNIGSASTGTSTYNIATGVTANGETKTVNIGTGGATGSTTNIYLGDADGGTVTVNKDLTVQGDLVVNGTTTTVNSTIVTVDDINIELGATASPSDTSADGGGIILKGTGDKTLLWENDTDSWVSSENFDLASGKTYKINAVDVLTPLKLALTNASVLAPNSTSVTSGSATSIGSFAAADFRSAKIHVQLTQSTDYMATEILVVHDGTNCYSTEYARVQSGNTIDATLDADISSGTVHLYLTSTSASIGSPVVAKVVVQAITV